MTKISGLVGAAAALSALFLAAGRAMASDSSYIVFNESNTNDTEWTFHNMKFYGDKTNSAYLWSAGSYVVSPLFADPVVRVSITFKGASASTRRTMEVVPLDASGLELGGMSMEFDPPELLDVAVAEWDAEAGVRQFRIGASTGNGNIQLHDCRVELAGGGHATAVPSGLENRDVKGNSFVAGWAVCAGAEAYLVDLRRVDRSESSWQGVAMSEGFDGAVNAGASPKEIKDVQAVCPMMDGERIYVPAATNGIVQIGSRDKAGCIALTGCSAECGRSLLFRAMRCVSRDEGTVMPLLWSDGATTNGFSHVVLGDEMADYEVPLDSVPAGSLVLLHSTTNRSTGSRSNGRVWLDSVSMVDGYSAAQVGTNTVYDSVRTSSASCRFSGLRRGATYLWRVRSVCGEAVSAPSPFMEVVPEGEMGWSGTSIILK